jgi:hypothetical protein
MRSVLLALVVLVLASPVAATGDRLAREKTPATVLALQETRKGDYLVRLNGASLQRVSKRVPLRGQATYAFAFSPDGGQVALGVDQAYGFRIVDLRRFKVVRTVRTWSKHVGRLEWIRPRRIVGFEDAGPFVVDPLTRKHLRYPKIDGNVRRVERFGDKLVFIAASNVDVEPVKFGVIDAEGGVRTLQLAGIRAGTSWGGEDARDETYTPGLAVDPAGRAFVVGTREEPIAKIDLATLSVAYHRADDQISWLARFRNWLEPAASAKSLSGSFRSARWLGDSKLSVAGYDYAPQTADRVITSAAGVAIVDTRSWKRQVLDPQASYAGFTAGRLLVSHGDSGVTAFSPSGERLYRIFEGQKVAVWATFGSRAFVSGGRPPVRVIDVATGRLMGTRKQLQWLIDPAFSTAW